MRTTLALDDDVYEAARKIAFEQRRALGAVVSDFLRRGLEAEVHEAGERPLGFWHLQVAMSEDFNDTPDEILLAVEADL
jgi:hypothetical protein